MSLDAFSRARSASRPSFAWSVFLGGEPSPNFEMFFCLWTGRFAALPQAAAFQTGPSSWQRIEGDKSISPGLPSFTIRVLGSSSRVSLT